MNAVRFLPFVALCLVALVIVPPASRARAATPKRPLRLMTYNVNYGNPNLHASLDAIADEDADIVLLQEITNEWKDALARRFATQYPHRVFRVHARAAGGLAVLSKFPITAEEVLSPPRGGWFPAERLVVESSLGALQILNVHLRPCLDGGSWVRGYKTTPPIRRREIEAYWKRIAYNLPTVVAGDFNEEPTGRAVAYLAEHGMTRIATTGPTTWHYETSMSGRTMDLLRLDIDHVMIDGNLAARDARVLDAGTSDHRPVVVTIEPRLS
jgi:endonuclease/exonuclease/phosphatase (EEP) superfamily protein YafD